MSEVTVQNTLFEALFHHILRPSPELAAEALRVGYDLERPRAIYPAEVWVKCVELALPRAYPTLPCTEALWKLGRDMANGYFSTLVGKVVHAALRVIGPNRAMRRVSLSFNSAYTGVKIKEEEVGPRDWVVRFQNYPLPPEAAAGTCEVALRLTGVEPRVKVSTSMPGAFELRISW
jgi:uncharacterized protein (TIGR02265 family)